MSGHTPGTWIAQADPYGLSDDWMVGLADGKPDQIAACSKRDAHILAAAPELYEALRDVLRIAQAASVGVSGNQPRLDRARAAISKARGEKL